MTLFALDPDRPWPDKERRYVSGAFITLNDKMRERLWQRCMPRRWRRRASRRSRGRMAEPGLIVGMRHLKGARLLRHATLREVREPE